MQKLGRRRGSDADRIRQVGCAVGHQHCRGADDVPSDRPCGEAAVGVAFNDRVSSVSAGRRDVPIEAERAAAGYR